MHRTLPHQAVQRAACGAELADLALNRLHTPSAPQPDQAEIIIAACRARTTVHGFTGHAALCELYEAVIRKHLGSAPAVRA